MPHIPRFFVYPSPNTTPNFSPDNLVTLTPTDSHHARAVLRLSLGDEIVIINPATRTAFRAKIHTLDDHEAVTAELIAPLPLPYTPPRQGVATLLCALTKKKTCDLVCEKAAELAVNNLIFWHAERSVLKIRPEERERRTERYERVALSAAKQCHRTSLPSVSIVGPLSEAIELLATIVEPGERSFVASLLPSAKALKNIRPLSTPSHLLIGPEGDLSAQENELLTKAGFSFISLGDTILRAETAAIAGVAMLRALWLCDR